ncbi:MFS transporter [Marinimicrobium sp. ABcell2]|uniref:MFS transporter n=1 Tax=Marinimicrobium sp. ABcell2 TaxID=3069751 RepID=UPI0027B62D0D|nr:MFS transporter [Marinimicrobium sp. ABcell2]MDQ2076054.1 MFS transporter [Marinimicrobium sp. ABcell2]
MSAASQHKLSILEKSGYAMGDAAANLVWRGALAYLAIFYTDTLGISAAAAAALLLVVRLSDGVTDIIMGMVADRTKSRHGKFRPWVLWSAPVLALFMILAFTAPDVSTEMKLVWAYFTYIGLTLAYTVNNVPYSALMGVMTPSHEERSVLSGYRFAGAFAGGVLVMGFTPQLVAFFGQGDTAQGYQYTMYIFATLLVALCMITFFTTRERVQSTASQAPFSQELKDLSKNLPLIIVPLLAIAVFFYSATQSPTAEIRLNPYYTGIVCAIVLFITGYFIRKLIRTPESNTTPSQRDLIDLLTNKPWLMILGLGFLTMMFNGIKYGVIAYYFTHYVGQATLAGWYFIVLLLISIFAALVAGYLTRMMGKKTLFTISLVASGALTSLLFFAGPEDILYVFIIGGAAEFFAAFMPVLIFSMLGDAADYSEWKHNRRATGLFYSAGTFIQKTGGGFAGALVLIVLSAYGYVGTDPATIAQATTGMIQLMSWIPAIFAFVSIALLVVYPLNTKRMGEIEADLLARRAQAGVATS